MNRRSLFITLFLIAGMLVLIGCVCTPSKLASVRLNLYPQHQDTWCWAATTEMISDYYNHRILQCDSSNFVHGTSLDCCNNCTTDCPCVNSHLGATITQIQNNWTHWNFTYTYVNGSLSWDTVKSRIYCAKSPIQAIWWWTLGGGHVINIYGYVETTVGNFVSYLNPWPPDCQVSTAPQCTFTSGGEDVVSTYTAFVSDASHTWGDSFHTFAYQTPTTKP